MATITDLENLTREIVSQESVSDINNFYKKDLRGKQINSKIFNTINFTFVLMDETTEIEDCTFNNCNFSHVIGLEKAQKTNVLFTECNFVGAVEPPQPEFNFDCIFRELTQVEFDDMITSLTEEAI